MTWYRGGLHAHSLWSDGNDFPEAVVEWYRNAGYHFVSLTDHGVLPTSEQWLMLREVQNSRRYVEAAFTKYLQRDPATIATRGKWGESDWAVRLKPFDELAAQFNRPGEFLLIPGEEVYAAVDPNNRRGPLHLGAINLPRQLDGQLGNSSAESINANAAAIAAMARETGRPMLMVVNHPNFAWTLTVDDLVAATAARFVEIYNAHLRVNHLGDETRPAVEKMWDLANRRRLLNGVAPLMGIATDDAHQYHVFDSTKNNPGRGWVMVNADRLDVGSLIAAMQAGEFYASSGVRLRSVAFDGTLRVEIEPDGDATYTTHFIGSTADQAGVVLASVEGLAAEYRPTGGELYVRAVVTSSRPHANPSFDGQKQQAWTQPVGWR